MGKYRSLSSSLCSFLHSPVSSSFVGPNIFLSTLFSNTLSLRFSLNTSDQVSHPHKTTGKLLVLYILIFKFLNSKITAPYSHLFYRNYVNEITAYWLDGPGLESLWGEIFRTSPDPPWGPPSLLYNEYRVFPGGNVRPGREADPSPLSSTEV